MAFDEQRGVSVMALSFYDSYYATWEQQFWQWNGSDWSKLSLLGAPGPLDWSVLVYDSVRRVIVLHGGYNLVTFEYLADVWSLPSAGDTWQRLFTAPSPRGYSALVYDTARGRSVMFGGFKPSGYSSTLISETWEEDGSRWILVQPQTSPPAVSDHGMVFDSIRNVTILFGGGLSSGLSNQLWEYDGQTWINRTPITGSLPEVRSGMAMAYDPLLQRTVIFGGQSNTGQPLSDTWEWDGNSWTQKNPANSPPGLYAARMSFDEARGRIFLYGGSGATTSSSVWEWSGVTWIERPSPGGNPGIRQGHSMLFDANLQQTILIGGVDGGGMETTWGWNGSAWSDLGLSGLKKRYYFGMSFDSSRSETLLFGGIMLNPSGYYPLYPGDTWTLKTVDGDGDGVSDCRDGCPLDPVKAAPGVCGCGISDSDSDGDDFEDCLDLCPFDGSKSAPGGCGCGSADIDIDGDSILDCIDQCPGDPLKSVSGVCGCGVSDLDTDKDGTVDCLDLCPADPAKTQSGACGCGVSDGDLNGNSVADCLDPQIAQLRPSKPKLSQKRSVVTVTLSPRTGLGYVASYRFLTGNKTKDRKLPFKILKPKSSRFTINGRKYVGKILEIRYRYILPGLVVKSSLESSTAKLRIKL